MISGLIKNSRWLTCALIAGIAFSLAGCAQKKDIHQTLRSNFAAPPSPSPQIIAAYQPWFGKSGHINVGYSSQDRVVLERQIEEAKGLGISAFVVNWYGPEKQFEDRSYSLLQKVAAERHFSTALMYDEPDDIVRSTADTIRDLQYAYQHYVGPQA